MPDIHYADVHRRSGEPSAHLHRRVATGEWMRLRRGAYVTSAHWVDLEPADRHLARVTAVAHVFDEPVFSHASAAALWDMPLAGRWPDEVHISYTGAAGMSHREGVRGHRTVLMDGDVVRHRGMQVTSPLRTALDLASASPLVRGVTVLDHVMATGSIDRESVADEIARRRPFAGVRRLELALSLASGLSESPLESLSMTRFHELAIPRPLQQHEVSVRGRSYRVDFFWPEHGVIGEADGRIKYLAGEDLLAEKQREDELREVVRGFVRWSWRDAWIAEPLRDKLARAGIHPVRRSHSRQNARFAR